MPTPLRTTAIPLGRSRYHHLLLAIFPQGPSETFEQTALATTRSCRRPDYTHESVKGSGITGC
ncbi:uncharacterized protein VDAG_01060 [Verticillium dahliae VdLs.17]|uniref:Uncharacterized protein n=1 Tax=Verticillium dahliae (strain VdLs.17 / ATCC MYA-4575 / FGSC 10137) TaxID=498257 RepID=G2WTD7_VERDV|nr:uncharacterized protein VDAG_01060 [Verticillium dahliae VdLs.17]EGY17378.1 hypothetical protein VDAG_01060 [Verticillium dahliae VdLs.17]